MNYEKKYKEAFKWIESLYPKFSHEQQMEAEAFFPELKESEDERIRKDLIEYFKWNVKQILNDFSNKECIAWLEKQKPIQNINKEDEEVRQYIVRIMEQRDINVPMVQKALAWLEKQGEQKPADKVEPKFKVGDWILYSGDHYEGVRHITKINEKGYYIERNGLPHGIIPFNHEICMRLWTIQDAKDGDVLISELSDSIILFKGIEDNNIQFYCDYDLSEIGVPEDRFAVNNSGQHYGNIEESEDFHPATKSQRDTLFAKMKEAGYEWLEETKKLKKIEQKPAWSEEDDMMIEETLYFLREYQQSNRCKDESGMQNSVTCEKWLKSLKERINGKQ